MEIRLHGKLLHGKLLLGVYYSLHKPQWVIARSISDEALSRTKRGNS